MEDEPPVDDDGRELGTFGKIRLAQRIKGNMDERQAERNQQQYQQEAYYQQPQQEIIYQQPGMQPVGQPQQIMVQPGTEVVMAPQQGMPQPGVVLTQPVAFAQGNWVKPDLCGLTCDGTCCYAACCAPCARGEQAQLMGGSYFSSFLIRCCFFCFSVCTLTGERNQIRTRFNIPATDGFCTALWCESCVVAQHLYQLRSVRPGF